MEIVIGQRCPGCHVVAVPDAEHLDSCSYRGKLKLVNPFKRGTIFRHGRMLDPNWKPGPGQKYADAPKAVCRVTGVRHGAVYFGMGEDATRGRYYTSPELLLANGAEIIR